MNACCQNTLCLYVRWVHLSVRQWVGYMWVDLWYVWVTVDSSLLEASSGWFQRLLPAVMSLCHSLNNLPRSAHCCPNFYLYKGDLSSLSGMNNTTDRTLAKTAPPISPSLIQQYCLQYLSLVDRNPETRLPLSGICALSYFDWWVYGRVNSLPSVVLCMLIWWFMYADMMWYDMINEMNLKSWVGIPLFCCVGFFLFCHMDLCPLLTGFNK